MTDPKARDDQRPQEQRADEQPADEFATQIPEGNDTVIPADDHSTVDLPDRRPPISSAPINAPPKPNRYDALVRGDQIGDFRIQRLLGRGSFGAVYLARELMLDRLVALKVVLPEGQRASDGEGRNLARLKHPNIVGVYGESKDNTSGCSLLWMQFVDGSNLAALIDRLHGGSTHSTWSENDLRRLMPSDPDKLDDEGDTVRSTESVCRMGQNLADALDHAHQKGITHRDIKPANILVDQDGTALLADFNLAQETEASSKSAGGTIAYMAPEQLARVIDRESDTEVGPRSDVYALGVVLWELASGSRPYESLESDVVAKGHQRLSEYLRIRSGMVELDASSLPIGLAVVLRRAVMPEPCKRYPSAAALATALRGLEQQQQAKRKSLECSPTSTWIQRNLFWIILVGGLLPHFAASFFQIAYNNAWITGMNQEAFQKAFITYNIIIYPACITWLAWMLLQFRSGYRKLTNHIPLTRSRLRRLRRRLLSLPQQFMIVSAVGWFPGALLFSYLVGLFDGKPLSMEDKFHFFVSWTVAGLIATTYSYFAVLYLVVCHGYGNCWQTATRYKDRVRSELSGMEPRIGMLAIVAGTLPLAAAVLLSMINLPSYSDIESMKNVILNMPSEEAAEIVGHRGIQIQRLTQLVIALIVFGVIGLYAVNKFATRITRTIRALALLDR